MTGTDTVLVVNAGSSSLKYELIEACSGERQGRGQLDRIGEPGARLVHDHGEVTDQVGQVSYAEAMGTVLDAFAAHGPSLEHVIGVGHRVVHGGSRFTSPVLVDEDVIATIAELVPLAPLHNQVALDCLAVTRARLSGTPQVAVFDTAFHTTIADHVNAFALPREVTDPHGLRRYGFHGTSVEYVVARAAERLGRDPSSTSLVVCHLGNGASVTSVRDGRSIDTSMGFSPLGGLVMGTRSGDVDASAVLYLLDQVGMPVVEVEDLLSRHSGLRGLTGDSDMRAIRGRAESGEPEALRALALCTHRIRTYIGAAVAQLPDLDALVFTGGIGENDARLRDEVCAPLAHLPIPQMLVVPTDEEHQIALHTLDLVCGRGECRHADHPAA